MRADVCGHASLFVAAVHQCSGKFGAGGTLWGLERAPSWVQGQSPWSGVRGGRSLELKAFLFLDIPTEGAIFRLTSKFRKLRKPHIFQVTSD